jgi:hypothetical protein
MVHSQKEPVRRRRQGTKGEGKAKVVTKEVPLVAKQTLLIRKAVVVDREAEARVVLVARHCRMTCLSSSQCLRSKDRELLGLSSSSNSNARLCP